MKPELSVIIPVTERAESLLQMHDQYRAALDAAAFEKVEFIYVVAPYYGAIIEKLLERKQSGEPIAIIELTRNFGEATAIKLGVQQANYDTILTLPPYEQVSPEHLPMIVDALEDNDVVVVKRWPRVDSTIKRMQSKLLNAILTTFSQAPFGDVGCGIRVCRKTIFDEITLYGDFHRFLPMLAYEQGFVVRILEVPQSKADATRLVYSPRTYLGRLLDVITIIFLTKFNKRPLRFFGAIGSVFLLLGAIGLGYLGIQRIFFDMAIGDRPALVLFVLFAVLGIQLIAIGLVGETLIFTHAEDIKEYRIRRIYE